MGNMNRQINGIVAVFTLAVIGIALASICSASPPDNAAVQQTVQNPAGERLIKAIRERNASLVEAALKDGADIEGSGGDYGMNPLMQASADGSVDMVKILLRHGANINAEARMFGFMPLERAAWKGHEDVVKYLIAHGADVNAHVSKHGTSAYLVYEGISPRNLTPLTSAAYCGSIPIIDMLLKAGAKIDGQDGSSYTPLMWAASIGNRDTVIALLKRGADRTVKSDTGKTARDMAIQHENMETAETLK